MSKEQLLKILKREKARRSFWAFCLYYDYEFFTKRDFLKQIADGFQKIYSGEYHAISVSMPPRAGKSYITSLYAAWFLGNKPQESVMRNTCTGTLYDKFSYDTRAIVRSEKFKEVFPNVKMQEDKQALFGWSLETAKQVSYFGGGVGGTIIGFGASGVAITDDLYKSLEEALSETVNEKTHSWKQSAHDSRLETGCPVIDIGTRWTTQDIIGQNIEKGKYDCSIVVPALTAKGKSFCENVKTTDEYTIIKNDILPEIWSGEYMQAPYDLEGIMFRRNELKRFSLAGFKKENSVSTLSYIDVADEGDDFFCQLFGEVMNGAVYITDVIFTQANVLITKPLAVAKIKQHKCNYVRVESNGAGALFAKALQELLDPSTILPVPNVKDKHTRILMTYGFIMNHMRFILDTEITTGSDYDLFLKYLCKYMKDGSFKKDDAPDATSGLAKMVKSFLPHLFPDGA